MFKAIVILLLVLVIAGMVCVALGATGQGNAVSDAFTCMNNVGPANALGCIIP